MNFFSSNSNICNCKAAVLLFFLALWIITSNGSLVDKQCSKKRQKAEIDFANKTDNYQVKVELDSIRNKKLQKEKLLGLGSFGSIFLVHKKWARKNARVVMALKEVKYCGLMDLKDGLSEVEVLNRLLLVKAQNVICLRAAWENREKTEFFMLFDYYRGGNLRSLLLNSKIISMDAHNKYELLVFLMKELLVALDHIHTRALVIHCDLKPENILVSKDVDTIIEQVKTKTLTDGLFFVSDFGNSIALKSPLSQHMGELCSPCYQSPQMARNQWYTVKQDIWSLGIIAMEIAFEKQSGPIDDLKILLETDPKRYFNLERLSSPLRDFIALALSELEYSRPTAAQLSSHPIFKGNNQAQSDPPHINSLSPVNAKVEMED